jgi:hypothetical protein
MTNKAIESTKLHVDIQQNPVVNNLSFVIKTGTEKYTNYAVNIYSTEGKLVYSSSESEIENNRTFKIDVSSLPSGNYFLTIKTNTNEKFTRKFSLIK